MTLTKYERETVINLNDLDDFAIITTWQRAMLTKLQKNPGAVQLSAMEFEGQHGGIFKIPARLISIRKPRNPSAEYETRLADRLADARQARSGLQQPLVEGRMEPIEL